MRWGVGCVDIGGDTHSNTVSWIVVELSLLEMNLGSLCMIWQPVLLPWMSYLGSLRCAHVLLPVDERRVRFGNEWCVVGTNNERRLPYDCGVPIGRTVVYWRRDLPLMYGGLL